MTDTQGLPELTDEKILAQREEELKNGIIARPLNDYEQKVYAGTIIYCQSILPYMTDAYAILSPFVDTTALTAYTDEHARVGLSYWFFYVITLEQRAAWITHEAMHVLNNHFVRAKTIGVDNRRMNIVGDLEINTSLSTVENMDINVGILPEHFDLPPMKTMEIYNRLLKNDDMPNASGLSAQSSSGNSGETASSSSGGSESAGSSNGESAGSEEDNADGNSSAPGGFDPIEESQKHLEKDLRKGSMSTPDGHGRCDDLTEERTRAADAAEIEKKSINSQNNARANTKTRVVDRINSGKVSRFGTERDFMTILLKLMSPPKADWRQIFRSVVSSAYTEAISGKTYTSYKRLNRRSQGRVIFPGTVDMHPNVIMGVDTSGSMSEDDYKSVMSEAEGILRQASRSKNGLKIFNVDTEITNVTTVRSVRDIKFRGGGGTMMASAFKYVDSLPKKEKPDIFVLGTDGFLYGDDWKNIEGYVRKGRYRTIILVTEKHGFENVPESLKKVASVILVDNTEGPSI